MTNRFVHLLCHCFLILCTLSASAQKGFRSQLSVISENDNYTFKYKDRYYTNGLLIRYAKLLQEGTTSQNKKILNAEFGQKIYNPYKQDLDFAATMDRPFTGLLYLKSGLTYFTPKENVFRWSLQAGMVGEKAFGKEVQRWHHRNFNLPTPYGWETQLKSEFGLNAQASYYQHLFSPGDRKRLFDVQAKGEAMAGTEFTAVTSGLVFKFGAFEKASGSTLFEARLHGSDKYSYQHKAEIFLYFEPAVTYQLYNATVQGGVFTRKKDQYTTDIEPIIYSHNFGIMYAENRFGLQLGFTYKTKEATTMRANENYGTIALTYQF